MHIMLQAQIRQKLNCLLASQYIVGPSVLRLKSLYKKTYITTHQLETALEWPGTLPSENDDVSAVALKLMVHTILTLITLASLQMNLGR